MPYADVKNLFLLCREDIIKYWQECRNEAYFLAFFLVLFNLLYFIIKTKYNKRKISLKELLNVKKSVVLFVFGIYSAYLLYVTLGMRYVGQRQEVNMMLFDIKANEVRFVVENLLLFIPFGFLCPMLSKLFKNALNVLLTAFGISLSIELLQYFFHCGKSEIDDVILNVFGTLIGYIIFYILRFLLKSVTKNIAVHARAE